MQNKKNLIVLWGNTCLQTYNMQNMSIFFLVDKTTNDRHGCFGGFGLKEEKEVCAIVVVFWLLK
jgi:hypothetical protein